MHISLLFCFLIEIIPQNELMYKYPTLQLTKKPLNLLLQFKTQDTGMVTKGIPCRTPHSAKPALKYVSLNLEVVPADFIRMALPRHGALRVGLICKLWSGSRHRLSAPLLLVQSKLSRKEGSRGLQGALGARGPAPRGPAQERDMEQRQHSHLWP